MNNVSTTILGVAVASKQVSLFLSSSPFPSSLSCLATSTRYLVASAVTPPHLVKPKPHAPPCLPPPTERDAPPSLPSRTAQVQVRTRVKLKEEEKTGREKVHGAGIMHKGRRLAPERAREDGARSWSKERKPGVIWQALFAVASPAKTKTKTNYNKSARVVNRRTAECTSEVGTSETGSEESDFTGSDEEDIPWISWFCSLRGNKFFCEVDEEFIQDAFNLSGLSSQVPYYDLALDLILDVDSPSDNGLKKVPNETVESAAEMLYGLIHARYILTSKGLSLMLEKYKNGDFGWCPRVLCTEQPCLPVGQSDIARTSPVKIYCPKCQDIYYPKSEGQASIDGSYFGTTFPHLFLMTFPFAKPPKPTQLYIPRIYGFKIHESVR